MQKSIIAGSLKMGQIEAVLPSNHTQFAVPGSRINPEKIWPNSPEYLN